MQKKERDDSFQIELMDAGGGATIGKLNKCIVTIVSDAGEDNLTLFLHSPLHTTKCHSEWNTLIPCLSYFFLSSPAIALSYSSIFSSYVHHNFVLNLHWLFLYF